VRERKTVPGTARPLVCYDSNHSSGKPEQIGIWLGYNNGFGDRHNLSIRDVGGYRQRVPVVCADPRGSTPDVGGGIAGTFRRGGRAATVVSCTTPHQAAPQHPVITAVFKYHDDGSEATVTGITCPYGTEPKVRLTFNESLAQDWALLRRRSARQYWTRLFGR